MELLLWKFIKFCLVGTIGLFIDFSSTYFLKEKWYFNKYLANSIGFCLAVLNNYMLNKYWTFQDSNPEFLNQGTKFLVISIIGLLLNNQIIYLLINRNKYNFYISKLIAIIVVVLWNFIANYFITFSNNY
ncbi:GtrA family protein [Gillisia marina]|uniref:GtrA family protein n=1 Tax=Gillisia marina TaxID=1167637 RepID=UPI00029AD150|nr:GtrA family protein [Gillisia marina]